MLLDCLHMSHEYPTQSYRDKEVGETCVCLWDSFSSEGFQRMYLSYWGRFEVPLDSYETLQLNEQVTRNMCVWVCLDQFASRIHRENGIVCEPSRGWT